MMSLLLKWKCGYCIFFIYLILISNIDNLIHRKTMRILILAGSLDVLELFENIIETRYIMRDHRLPNRVRSVYFVDNKGYFEQMINGRISFVLSRSINWSLCTIKTTFYSLSFCFLTTKKSFSHCTMHCLACVVRC